MQHLIHRIRTKDDANGDLQLLKTVAAQINGKCLCALGDFSTMAVTSAIERFPEDFQVKVMSKA
jgi:NADH-quinone oxidoreductase subunit F